MGAKLQATVYYNPKCGTCRKVLEALEQKGLKPAVIEYLKTPPSEAEIDELLKKLGLEPEALARKKEPLYQKKALGRSLSRAQWLKLFHENPILIERPVVVLGEKAVIARPPEALERLF